mgnify:CR=1 FL=1
MYVVKQTGKKLSELAAEVTTYPQKLVNVRVQDKKLALENQAIKDIIKKVEDEMAGRRPGISPSFRNWRLTSGDGGSSYWRSG